MRVEGGKERTLQDGKKIERRDGEQGGIARVRRRDSRRGWLG